MWVKTFDDELVNLDRFDTIDIKERVSHYALTATITRPTLYKKGIPPVSQNTSVTLWASADRISCKHAQDVVQNKLSENVSFVRLRSHLVASSLPEGNKNVD